jgi:hypothetical protein
MTFHLKIDPQLERQRREQAAALGLGESNETGCAFAPVSRLLESKTFAGRVATGIELLHIIAEAF